MQKVFFEVHCFSIDINICRFTIHRITNQEAKYKLCRVKAVKTGPKNVPFLYTSDGRTIRYPDPLIKVIWHYLIVLLEYSVTMRYYSEYMHPLVLATSTSFSVDFRVKIVVD